jgi:hypothetical protein
MDEIISYKMCAVKVLNAKLRNYLNNVKTSNKTLHHIVLIYYNGVVMYNMYIVYHQENVK